MKHSLHNLYDEIINKSFRYLLTLKYNLKDSNTWKDKFGWHYNKGY